MLYNLKFFAFFATCFLGMKGVVIGLALAVTSLLMGGCATEDLGEPILSSQGPTVATTVVVKVDGKDIILDKASGKILCKTDADCEDANSCVKTWCGEAGTCKGEYLPEGASCDYGLGCMVAECTESGGCAGVHNTCDDGNPCTADFCGFDGCRHELITGCELCVFDADCSQDKYWACWDKNTSLLVDGEDCVKGICQPQAVASKTCDKGCSPWGHCNK